ncbi:MAG: RsmE family RNA methyltransferase, partial [Polyangiaceae bacterium]|nr:RsmE family RNA methyltransferase [Polyangiaceae bacterium]
LQYSACIGLQEVVLFRSARVEKSYFSSPLLSPDKIKEQLWMGAEQGKRTDLPTVKVVGSWHEWLEQCSKELPLLAFHPDSAENFAHLPRSASQQPLNLVIGPEGGLLDGEVETLKRLPAKVLELGPQLLRTETAVVAAFSQLQLHRMLHNSG